MKTNPLKERRGDAPAHTHAHAHIGGAHGVGTADLSMGRAWLVYAGVGPSVKASAQTSISQEKMAHPVLRESDFTIHRPRSRAHTIFQSLRRTLTEERSSSDLGEPPHDGLMQGFCTVSGVYSGKTRLLRKYGGEAMEWAPGVEVGKGLQHVLEVYALSFTCTCTRSHS